MNARTHRYWALFSKFVRQTLLGVCIGSLLVVSAGCMASSIPSKLSISFEGLCGLTQEQFAAMDEPALIQWIQSKYGVTPWTSGSNVEAEIAVTVYEWEEESIYGIAVLHDGQIVWILVEDKVGLSFGQVVDALGPPETVKRDVTRQENTVYTLRLEYPAKGFSVGVHGVKFGYVTHERLLEYTQVNSVVCHSPGPLETVLEEVFLIAPENMPYQMSKRMAWPGFGASIPLDPAPPAP